MGPAAKPAAVAFSGPLTGPCGAANCDTGVVTATAQYYEVRASV